MPKIDLPSIGTDLRRNWLLFLIGFICANAYVIIQETRSPGGLVFSKVLNDLLIYSPLGIALAIAGLFARFVYKGWIYWGDSPY